MALKDLPWLDILQYGLPIAGQFLQFGAGLAGTKKLTEAQTAMMEAYTNTQQEVRTLNEERYKEILAGYEDREAAAAGVGEQGIEDIMRLYQNIAGGSDQDMISRGLSGTTAKAAGRTAVAREGASSLQRQREGQQTFQAGLARDRLEFMERRQDLPPDPALYLGLAQQYGRTASAGYGTYFV